MACKVLVRKSGVCGALTVELLNMAVAEMAFIQVIS